MSAILTDFKNREIERFLKQFKTNFISISGLNNPLRLLLLKSVLNSGAKAMFVVQNEQSALKFQNDFKSMFNVAAEVFPYQEINFYEDISPNYAIYQEQVEILTGEKPLIIAPVRSLMEKFPAKKFYCDNSVLIKKGYEIDYNSIIKKLVKFGYKRVTTAVDVGEFCVRGDIIDIFTLAQNPVRIELFGDSVEDIRYFNPNTQKSFQKAESITIFPLYKFILENKNIKAFEKLNFKNKELHAEIVEKLNENKYFEGIEYYQSYFNPDLASVFDHFSDYVWIFDETSQIQGRYEIFDNDFTKSLEETEKSELKLPLKTPSHTAYGEFLHSLKKLKVIGFDNFITQEDATLTFDTSVAPIFCADIEKIAAYIKKSLNEGYRIFICTNYKKRLEEILGEFEIFSSSVEILPALAFGGGVLENEKFIFLTDKELFNKHSKDVTVRKYLKNKQSQDYIDSINDISQGEYVVHSVHGIGIYRGLTKKELDGNLKDYLEIEFLGGDKLFMPAEQVNLLFRYRGAGTEAKPRLSKMGGMAWENIKNRAKKEVEEVAKDLLILYAEREMATGIAFDPDTTWQFEMEDAFEFSETEDQMKAIIDTKADMEASKPMDRLICADVGFGKTEVAMRAMFKAVMSGKQAAMVVPTTILALQHFETVQERFKPFSVEIDLLSRFRSKKEQKETLERLKNGRCDIVIGTHRLLQNDIAFKDLGLLVIDEEHRFGVRHKEKLKQLRKNIDILTLSATPIPRTLNMALSGLKDMSLINTPPKNRLPIKTYAGEFNEKYVKSAINTEIQRDGQVFYLYNRIESIYSFRDKLQKLVPNASIAIAHGQMREGELERVMCEFAQKKYDILLCTTIIESGLDLPNTNTIIIHDCDRFGLAQLYQLRGRVGRSDRQAYCYCFYKQSKELTPEAYKRLNAIKDFTVLGSGYHIALKDIEIRGVGNILGSKQHGHMVSVGFDTYCNLLEECINELQSKEPPKKTVITTIDLNVTAFIPDEWVGSVEQKILEYKRLSDVKTLDELENMALSLKDRFSKLPQSVENLIKLIKLRLLANSCSTTLIREAGDTIRVYTPFTLKEWLIIRNTLSENVKKYITFQNAPKALTETHGILLVNKSNKNFDEIFNILGDLFYHVSKVILDFNQKINKKE